MSNSYTFAMDNQLLQDNVKAFTQEIQPILKKYNLKMGAIIDFPLYKKYPIEVQLALEVLKNHGAEYKVAFQEEVK